MKFFTLPFLIAGAGLALLQASASPIRIVVVTSNVPAVSPNIRFGHPVPQRADASLFSAAPDSEVARISGRPKERRPCFGMTLREKALSVSNSFRKAMGLPPLEDFHSPPRPGEVHILPFLGDPNAVPHPHHNGHNGMVSHRHHRGSFFRRIHHALMALGPWEGRAVAFVLGCGIGVLLRMVWVMAVVAYRMFKGGDEDEAPEYRLVCEHYAEEILVPPPQYLVEKADDVDAKA